MKNFLLLLLLATTACKAQNPTIPLYDTRQNGYVNGAYYQDTNSDFDLFVGTWEYSSGSTSFKIVLQKRIQFYNDVSDVYEDMLIGEYRYVENGIEKVNTLNLLPSPPPDLYEHTIKGNLILGNQHRPICTDCAINEKRVSLTFGDPHRDYTTGIDGQIILRRMDVGSVQKIQLILMQKGNLMSIEGQPAPPSSFNVPWGTYTLTKI